MSNSEGDNMNDNVNNTSKRSIKQGRTTAKRMFTSSIRAFDQAIQNNETKSVIESLFSNIDKYWLNVQTQHASYLEQIL